MFARVPSPDASPSSAFLTPSTASSATRLAGLFHPAAAFRVLPKGLFPRHSRATSSVTAALSSVGDTSLQPVARLRRVAPPRPQGVHPCRDLPLARRKCYPASARSPSRVILLQVFAPHTPVPTLVAGRSARDLHRPLVRVSWPSASSRRARFGCPRLYSCEFREGTDLLEVRSLPPVARRRGQPNRARREYAEGQLTLTRGR